MYVVLFKPKNKVLTVKEETYARGSRITRGYSVYIYHEDYKHCISIMMGIKNGIIKVDLDNPIETEEKETAYVQWEIEKIRGLSYVYGLYDDVDRLLYVGISSRPEKRYREHKKSGKNFLKMEVLFSFVDRQEAESFERYAINNLQPPLNVLVEGEDDSYVHSQYLLDCFGTNSGVKAKNKINGQYVRIKYAYNGSS